MNLRKFISGVSALAIAASAFAGMAVTASAANVVTENFNSKTVGDVGNDWKNGVAQNGTREYVDVADGDIAFKHTGAVNAARVARYKFSDTGVELNNSNVTASFKIKPFNIGNNNVASAHRSDTSLLDQNGDVIIGVSFEDADSTATVNKQISYYTGGTALTTNGFNGGTETAISDSSFDDDKWYTVTVSINYSTAKATLTVSDGADFTKTAEDIDVSVASPMKFIHNAVGRSNGSARATNAPGNFIDDIIVDKDEVTAVAHTVSFTGDADTITVEGAEVSGNSIDLYDGTYNYIAKKAGYQTVYDTVTVNGANVTEPISFTAIPTAPETVNGGEGATVEPVSLGLSTEDNGFKNYNDTITFTNLSSDFNNIGPGETVVIEYDAFVTGENSLNLTLNPNTGANLILKGQNGTVVANYYGAGNAENFIGSYTSGQWAHVKLSIPLAYKNGTVTTLKTASVSAVITPKDNPEQEITSSAFNVRNLGTGASSGSSFGQVTFYGTANIANAEIYVTGTRIPVAIVSDMDYKEFPAINTQAIDDDITAAKVLLTIGNVAATKVTLKYVGNGDAQNQEREADNIGTINAGSTVLLGAILPGIGLELTTSSFTATAE